MIKTRILERNPFPGVRPFKSAEDKFFFGRENTVSEVLDSLLANRFVALVGASGSGKTSLIQSGIIPALLTDEKQEWVPVTIRPGLKPVESLIRGFQKVFPKKLTESDVHSFLAGSQSLGDMINEKGLGSHNYYLVVDQFEELFRNGLSVKKKKKNGKNPENIRFVDLLVKAVNEARPGIFVMLSIRSDFIDACSTFRSLTEQMNKSKYLLPHMTRDALAKAITGPIRQAGASVESGFEEYVLDDMEEVDAQLPMLQHALMRTWDYWVQQGDLEQPIAITDYQAIGTIRNALSDHLNEAFNELNNQQKVICEQLFKSITYKSEQHEGFRRQASIGYIARIAQCNVDDVASVVEVFRKPGRAFISPHAAVSLKSDSQIELSHESLIWIWERLKKWVDEEAESIRMYLKLSEASALYQQGRAELWKPPELQYALNWRNTQNPTPAWGVQYNPAFERAMVFLSTSEEEYLWEEERKVFLQRRRLILNRAIAIFMGVLVVVLAVVFFTNRNKPAIPEQPEQVVEQDYTYVPETRPTTPVATEEVTPDPIAEEITGSEPETGEEITPTVVNEVEQPVTRNRRSQPSDDSRTSSTRRTSTSSQQDRTVTSRQRETVTTPVTTASNEASNMEYQRRVISIAKRVSQQSVEVSKNTDLQGLLAYQAYRINSTYNGKYYDVDIYNGLYAAMKKLISPAYNIYPNLRNSVKAIEWLDRTGSILTASSDGSIKILSGRIADRASQISLAGTGLNNECLAVSPDERTAAVGTNGGGLLFLELENRGNVIHRNTDQGKIVLFLQNLGNSGSFLSAGTDNRILKWEYGTFESSVLVTTSARPSALAASTDGQRAAFGTRDGKLFELNVNAPDGMRQVNDFGQNQIRSLAYSPGGQYLVAGLLDGSLRVLAGNERRNIATLRGPGARVTDLAYSPDGRFLVAASHDGNVYLWNTSDWSNPPIVFNENNGFVLAVCFSKNSRHFYSGSVDYPRLIGRPSESAEMARDFCSLVGRNLTQAEWDQYFGGEIPYEETCPGMN
jgi:WD40 repeat protein